MKAFLSHGKIFKIFVLVFLFSLVIYDKYFSRRVCMCSAQGREVGEVTDRPQVTLRLEGVCPSFWQTGGEIRGVRVSRWLPPLTLLL